MLTRAMVWVSLVTLTACDAGVDDTPAGGSGGGAPGGGTAVGGSGGSVEQAGGSGAGSDGGGFIGEGGAGGALPEIAEVFGHSANELYRLDPDTKQVTLVAPFNGCSSVIDIALDKDSNIIGTTFGGLYQIDKTTAACTEIAIGGFPNSLSFIPAGTLDPNVEALVGYNGSQYVRIDPISGAVTNLGSLSGGFFSSGDIVSVKDGGTYLTVQGPGCNTDCLVEVNPATGEMVKNWGPVGYLATYGIAFWAGTVYGFSEGGQLFELTFDNDLMTSTLIASPGTAFWGAGSTTSAPPIEIPE